MASNPRPWLLTGLISAGVVLVALVVAEMNGLSQVAPLAALSTVLFGAFLTALIATSIYDFVSEQSQRREWLREDTYRIFGPIYEEMLKNTESLRSFENGSRTEWDKVSNERISVLIPDLMRKTLQVFFDDIQGHWPLRNEALEQSKRIIREVHEREFRGLPLPPNPNYDAFAYQALFNDWSGLLDGNLERLAHPNAIARYEEIYNGMTQGVPTVRQANEVVRECKTAINADPKIDEFKKATKTLLTRAAALAEELRAVLLRPYGPMDWIGK